MLYVMTLSDPIKNMQISHIYTSMKYAETFSNMHHHVLVHTGLCLDHIR